METAKGLDFEEMKLEEEKYRQQLGEDLKLECKICGEDMNEATFFCFSNCEHMYCKECLRRYLETEIS